MKIERVNACGYEGTRKKCKERTERRDDMEIENE